MRLPPERMLDRQIVQANVSEADIVALVVVLEAFYRGATTVHIEASELVARFSREQATNRRLLLQPGLQSDSVAATLDRSDAASLRQAGTLGAGGDRLPQEQGHATPGRPMR